MVTLTRYTAKFYKDSTKTFYAVFTSASENPIIAIEETTTKYSYNLSTELLNTGAYTHVLSFPKTTSGSDVLLFNLEFKDGTNVSTSGQVPSDSQTLVSAHDSLSFFTTFSDFDADSKSYSISDSIYYSKSPYNVLYVYPQSSVNYLDTSSTEDFYYATAGGAAYIASNDLQNDFLIGREYSLSGIDQGQLGKFAAGKGAQTLKFSQYADVTKVGPVIHGHTYVDSKTVPIGGNTYYVSKNAAASNYYLNGCAKLSLPCTDDGTTFSADCKTGVVLTSAIINDSNNIFKEGGCAASCDGFALKVIHNKKASTLIAADGSIQVEVISGKADYTYSLSSVEIGTGLTFSSATGTSSSADISFLNLYAGEYLLVITDANSPTCTLREVIYVDSERQESYLKGCKTSTAINYVSSTSDANAWADVCVFCNAAGKLIRYKDDSDGIILGPYSKTALSTYHSTSRASTGVSNDDGKVIIDRLSPISYTVGKYLDSSSGKEVSVNFNTGDHFIGGTDYEYKLYSLEDRLAPEYADSTFLAANGTVIATQSNVGGAIMQFTDLPPANYAVKISYTHDSSAEEYEECYIIESFSILQQGCTDKDSQNYNPLALISDGTCKSLAPCPYTAGTYMPDIPIVFETSCSGKPGPNSDVLYQVKVNPDIISSEDEWREEFPVFPENISTNQGNWPNSLPVTAVYFEITVYFSDNTNTTTTSYSTNVGSLLTGYNFYSWPCSGGITPTAVNIKFNFGDNIFTQNDGPGPTQGQGSCTVTAYADVPTNNSECCTEIPGDVLGCTDSTACNYDVTATIDNGTCEWVSCLEGGCTDDAACNYDAEAEFNDGSCEYTSCAGCTDPIAENYDANAIYDDGSCTYAPTPCELFTEAIAGATTLDYITSTNATTVYNTAIQECEVFADGTVTVTLPATLISGAGVTPAYWIPAIKNTSTDLWYSNIWEGGIEGTNAEIEALVQDASLYVSDNQYFASNESYVFAGMSNGLYHAQFFIHTAHIGDGYGNTVIVAQPDGSHCIVIMKSQPVGLGDCTGAPAVVFGCTDSTALTFNPLATDDDGTCIYADNAGCTDPYASNYNPNVFVDDGSCSYKENPCAPPVVGTCVPNMYTENSTDVVSSCCIPADITLRLNAIEECLANSGSRFYNKMITGLSDSCSTMDAWKMLIILEVLRKRGLPCVYNCSDAATQSLSGVTCYSVWVDQGSLVWHDRVSYQMGHVVQSSVNNKYYVATNNVGLDLPPNTTVSNPDNKISGWQKCCDEVTYSGNVNYLTSFISFAEKYCKDCEIPPYLQNAVADVKVISNITVGGVNIKNNGGSFEAS